MCRSKFPQIRNAICDGASAEDETARLVQGNSLHTLGSTPGLAYLAGTSAKGKCMNLIVFRCQV